ncbi:helix-turn-helix transcriptional regulator [Methylonatrum kenyense]|nr:helix-turn-helix transcriptional regulator [Methylonatrum kenyense]MCK8517295.1 helix-turn-helix transcriptional regulator [Methylonatrum kenyense]
MYHELMTTTEVADYLRLRQRKIYELVRQQAIPCTRITGKLLFPRQAVDLWLNNHLEADTAATRPPPEIFAGSHDPLLEWALRESDSHLASLCRGSGDGVQRLLDGRAMVVGLHITDPETGAGNDPLRCGLGGLRDLVLIHWARRRQGLLLPPGNPKGIQGLNDLFRDDVTVVRRQTGAGADSLLRWLLGKLSLEVAAVRNASHTALGEDDLALDVREARADCGLGVEAAARRHGLDFLPLHTESFDLAMRRRSYFEPPVQALLRFAASAALHERAAAMGGYDLAATGSVRFNA